jgi:hypothetical protein
MFIRRQNTTYPAPVVSKENHGPRILAITGTITMFALVVFLARLYVRAFVLRKIGPDDYVISISMVSSTTLSENSIFANKLALSRGNFWSICFGGASRNWKAHYRSSHFYELHCNIGIVLVASSSYDTRN